MATAPTAAPPTPTPAPPQPTPAAPAPKAEPSPAPQPAPQEDSAFAAELESKFAAANEKLSPKKEAPKEPAKPDKEVAKPDKEPARGPAELRKEYERIKGEHEKFKGEYEKTKGELTQKAEAIAALETKIKEWESKGKDTAVMEERLSALEKDLQKERARSAALSREESEAVKAARTDFNTAADLARSDVEQMVWLDEEGNMTSKKATWDDFVALYRMPRITALNQARKAFGEDGARVVDSYLTELRRLDKTVELKKKLDSDNYEKTLKEHEANEAAQRERLEQARHKVDGDLVESVREYRDSPDDKESSELRQAAYKEYDSKPKTLQQYVVKERHARHIFAAHFPMRLKVARLERELSDAKSELEKFKNPQPTPGKKTGGDEKAGDPDEGLSWEEAARKSITD